MLSECQKASAIGARTARACDGCMLRRARWFCASDDAFLCHACDVSVHSANQLAGRHQRVRISTASLGDGVADWDRKVTRRARTPRNGLKGKLELKEASSLIVPEIGVEEEQSCENEDLMVFQVPVFDADCGFWNEDESTSAEELHRLLEFVPDDIQYTAGHEGLSGVDSSCDNELLDSKESKKMDVVGFENNERNYSRVKMEGGDDEIEAVLAFQFDSELMNSDSRESLLDWDFGFESDEMMVKGEEVVKMIAEQSGGEEAVPFGKGMLLLKLNCEQVMSAWDDQGCPWMDGTPPEFDPIGDGWPKFPGVRDANAGPGNTNPDDENGGSSAGGGRVVSEERVARVTRYREKRRSRLFSKKIRYEVRKLNAEKRPRMKGRFVKRVQSYVGPQIASLK
uniref:Uncharacterized protein n=1 Tax=Kalanchoe fedtschenkoi TaxID=63787 RepID=A0A7N0V0T2_KALFE